MEHNEVMDIIMKDEDYYKDFITRSVNASNRIEGSTLSYEETHAILWGDDPSTQNDIKLRDLYETVNLKNATNRMVDAVKNGEELSERLIIELNEIINRNILDTKGYRQVQVYIRGADEIPPAPSQIRHRMMYLIDNFRIRNDRLPLMEEIALFHIMFEHTHPFEDFNGRTGRLLLDFMLMKAGEAPVVIPDEMRDEYFKMISDYQFEEFADMLTALQKEELDRIETFQETAQGKRQTQEQQ